MFPFSGMSGLKDCLAGVWQKWGRERVERRCEGGKGHGGGEGVGGEKIQNIRYLCKMVVCHEKKSY